MPRSGLSELVARVDPGLAAVVDGDHVVDFEQFDECIDWLCGDLGACGVRAGHRVGLYIRGGWEFVLTLHALVRLDAVVTPLDPLDDSVGSAAGGVPMDFLLSHRIEDDVLEDAVLAFAVETDPPMYSVADDYILVVLNDCDVPGTAGGFVFADTDGAVVDWDEFAGHLDAVRRALGLEAGTQVRVCSNTVSAEAISVVLASAAAGACVHLGSAATGSAAWTGADGTVISVLFAPASMACAMIETAPIAVRDGLRLATDRRERLSEAVLRRYGMVRRNASTATIYEFADAEPCRELDPPRRGRGAAGLRSVS